MKNNDNVLVGLVCNLILSLHHNGELEDVNGNLSTVKVVDYLNQFNDEWFITDVVTFVKEHSENNVVTFSLSLFSIVNFIIS